jgi:cytochrome o ubiquinol oxidase operon protein cyoD
MSDHSPVVAGRHDTDYGTARMYVTGFISSLVLTVTAYLLVVNHAFSRHGLIAAVVVLALTQFFVQVIFFLHLGRESKPRWKLAVFLFMTMVVLILVFGSLWIMTNLNYRMTPQQINNYMNEQSGF